MRILSISKKTGVEPEEFIQIVNQAMDPGKSLNNPINNLFDLRLLLDPGKRGDDNEGKVFLNSPGSRNPCLTQA